MISSKKNKKLIAFFISVLMCFCICACGGNGSVEETVEITTPAGDTAQADDGDENEDEDTDEDKDADEDENKDADDAKSAWSPEDKDKDKSDKSEKEPDSPYKKIYKEYNNEMEKATEKYVSELKDKADSVSKNELYDETQNRIEDLKKIYDKGKETMVNTMLKSTEDDEDAYKKYFNKMTEKYTEYTREITAAYTDQF